MRFSWMLPRTFIWPGFSLRTLRTPTLRLTHLSPSSHRTLRRSSGGRPWLDRRTIPPRPWRSAPAIRFTAPARLNRPTFRLRRVHTTPPAPRRATHSPPNWTRMALWAMRPTSLQPAVRPLQSIPRETRLLRGISIRATPTGLLVESAGNPIIAGTTSSPVYPTTPRAYQPEFFGSPSPQLQLFTLTPPASVGFVTKLNATGSSL